MRNLAGRLNRKIELWENVKTESVNAIGQTKWEGRKVRDLWAEVIKYSMGMGIKQ